MLLEVPIHKKEVLHLKNKTPAEIAKWIVVHLPELIAGAALVIAVSLTVVNAFTRYFLSFTIKGSDEINILAFAWMVFPGCACAYREKQHYGIDLVVNSLPKKAQAVVKIVAELLSLVVLGIMFYLSVVLFNNVGTKILTATRISYKYFDAAMVVGFGLMALYSFLALIEDIRALPAALRAKKEKKEDAK